MLSQAGAWEGVKSWNPEKENKKTLLSQAGAWKVVKQRDWNFFRFSGTLIGWLNGKNKTQ